MKQICLMDMFKMTNEGNDAEKNTMEVENNETSKAPESNTKDNSTKTESKSAANTSVTKKAKETKATTPKNRYAKVQEELKNFIKVEVKVFGSQVFVFEGEEVEKIDLEKLQKQLVELGYGEFATEVVWAIVPNKAKTEAILVAGCKFYNKG
ncbi:hypothetical protein B5G18_14720 [Clostridium perfringens]|uniref:hypothetical protein n=1 Tax=Clostridium perfringens TaxID=1502 RepID=UPI000B390A77|nr:hypothetical protein [Clostridium perfringens]OUN49602.1 hypothetical protein B5G18_14720 [Clostridium perfringens]OUP46257.1 hypothetical protein B5F20_09815 [Clostridium perfringens]